MIRDKSADTDRAQIERDIEKARSIQASMRKDAPAGLKVGSAWVDPRETLARRLVPEGFWSGPPTSSKGQGRKGSVPPKMCTAYYAKSEHAERVAEGWEPVLENGEHTGRDGDLLYKRPIEFSRQHIKQASDMSEARVSSQDAESAAAGLTIDKTEIERTDNLA
jgi:hypothetical protein